MGNNMKITELDRYLFGQGTHYEIYKLLGAHPGTQRKKEGVFLRSVGSPRKGRFCSRKF